MTSARCCGLSGSSIGWVVNQHARGHIPTGDVSRAAFPFAGGPSACPSASTAPAAQAKPAFDEDDLQLREALEHALEHHAGQCVCMPVVAA